MSYKNQNYMTNKLIKSEVDKNQKHTNNVKENNQPQNNNTQQTNDLFYYKAYNDDNLVAQGSFKLTNEIYNDYSQIQILTDSIDTWDNVSFYVETIGLTDADAVTLYDLFEATEDIPDTPYQYTIQISKTSFE